MASSNTPSQRIVQNFHLIWLDANVDGNKNEDYRNSVTQLRQVVNTINTFVDPDECAKFIDQIKEEKAFIISSGFLIETAVSVVHDKPQVNKIYIFCGNETRHEKWIKEWPKIQGVFTDIKSICVALKEAVKDVDHNAVTISCLGKSSGATKEKVDSVDCSFMYTQILKEILLTIDFESVHFNEFLSFCRKEFVGNVFELENVERIAKEYDQHRPIWWYTYQSFLYSMLNRALRLMDVDLIIKMGFFMKALHVDIAKLHFKQFGSHKHSDSFTVYRGQGLPSMAFDGIKQTQAGLLSFNNFLSTSTKHDVSLEFARQTINTPDLVGVLFVIEVDPKISTTPFANVKEVSFFTDEDEILFSMHSVFRIGQIQQIDGDTRLWQVNLTLTSDNDPQLYALSEQIRKETFPSLKGWERLGNLLIKLGQFNKAEQICEILLVQTTDVLRKAMIYIMLGLIKTHQGKYEDAVQYYEQSINIQKHLPQDDMILDSPYHNLASVYHAMGEYSKALSYYKKPLEIDRKTISENHPNLIPSYKNIGTVYKDMGEYSKALSYSEKALEIERKTLPENHPDLAGSYSNIGSVYADMGEYSNALLYYEKALEIRRKALPEDHPDIGHSYHIIGTVYDNMGQYSKALSYIKKALEIRRKAFPEDHPDIGHSYHNIGAVYKNMGEHSTALSYCEKALEIRRKTLPESHPDLAISYNNIGAVYADMGEHSKALSYYKQTLEIQRKTLPEDHPNIASCYNNIGAVYADMGEHSKTLSYYEKALEIRQKTLSGNHPDLGQSYHNIGSMYQGMKEYSKALSYYEKALEIWRKTLPENPLHLATSYACHGSVYDDMGDSSKALSCYEKALEIRRKTLPEDHPKIASCYNNIGAIYDKMGQYSKALSYFEKALEIKRKTLPESHPDLATSYYNVGGTYNGMGQYSNALSYYEKALEIDRKTLPENHPNLASSYNDIADVYKKMNNYGNALQYFERALTIWKRSLPSNHPKIKTVKDNIEIVRKKPSVMYERSTLRKSTSLSRGRKGKPNN